MDFIIIWNLKSFPQGLSNGIGYKQFIISYAKINFYVMIIWIIVCAIFTLLSFYSIYNLIDIEYNLINLLIFDITDNFKNKINNLNYIKNKKNLKNHVLYFGKDKKNNKFVYGTKDDIYN